MCALQVSEKSAIKNKSGTLVNYAINPGEQYEVHKNDSLWKIAKRLKKEHPGLQTTSIIDIVDSLDSANKLENRNKLRIGQSLNIPTIEVFQGKAQPEPKKTPKPADEVTQNLMKLNFSALQKDLKVKKGDTLSQILFNAISIKGNPENKEIWENFLETNGLTRT
ncbi:MAG: LysM domain-containing protein, partial [Candidatus Margulisbacteria bacterium]|nr:LysM domain-containing protein [Candidatus Margulisiibacteriota bacterium]